MRIEIIGAGSVGLLIASYLIEQQTDVTLVKRQQYQKEQSIARTNIDGNITSDLHVSIASRPSSKADLIIVAVKYGQLQAVYPMLADIPVNIPILFVQNGLAHFEEALQLPQQQIAFSSIQFGAQKIEEFHVAHKGIGVMKVAVARGDLTSFTFFKKFSKMNFPIDFEQDAELMLLEKALLNCFINPLTAILQLKNGQLITENNPFQLLKNLYNEVMTVFPQYEKIIQFGQVVALCEKTAANTSSMLGDRLAGRKTEIDTIVAPILKKAALQNQTMPMLQTVYLLVKAFEESGEKM
ncbi:2-dehydropantoate 2-reductase [Solibacillus sp. MA9]|uniref:2-dehydropantoate 2-reductase n=1 Tax=Solibacillus palustris TaxID=2908203 RepID=A0ABS9UA01_9BACL|nr:2-dehydropantoate 2-reductase [Solibacillus sp. MA9]MCH7320828.1 2-dehydropantoate 2-reductase [Solibacillus sp. MA9]